MEGAEGIVIRTASDMEPFKLSVHGLIGSTG